VHRPNSFSTYCNRVRTKIPSLSFSNTVLFPHQLFRRSALFLSAWLWLATAAQSLSAQTVNGGTIPNTSAMLGNQRTARGVLFPRLTTTQQAAVSTPDEGRMLYYVITKCLELNLGSPASPVWIAIKCQVGYIASFDCSNPVHSAVLNSDSTASGVSVLVPYPGGNGGTHASQTVTSTGVTCLKAMLSAGNFAVGADSLSYAISGIPDTAGTVCFALNIGGQNLLDADRGAALFL
jgi:hypothetical protein